MPTLEHWHSPTVLSEQDMLRMQRDAQQRVRRMQRQADETIRQAGESLPDPPHKASPPPAAPSGTGQAFQGNTDTHGGSSVLSLLLQDQDRLLLLALLLLLRAEKADLPLMLAIGYILL